MTFSSRLLLAAAITFAAISSAARSAEPDAQMKERIQQLEEGMSAFPAAADIYLVGNNTDKPNVANVKFGDVVTVLGTKYLRFHHADSGAAYVINPAQIAMVKVAKRSDQPLP